MYLKLGESIFPVIFNDVAMRHELSEKTEIRFMEQPNGTIVCSYIVAAEDTFDSPFSREARGIVFDASGEIISRPLHKFFNVNERTETQLANIDWTDVSRVMVKRDGSMIHTVAIKDGLKLFDLKSKKSFSSDVVLQAEEWLSQDPWRYGAYHALCTYAVTHDLTAIFEWTSPTARIVLHYPENELQLLHIRENNTGRYFTKAELIKLSRECHVPLVKDDESIQDLIANNPKSWVEIAQAIEGVEGWVIQFNNGDMVKLKTKWYLERHRAMTFLRERDIALMTLHESIDDLKSLLVGEGADITEILKIEADVVHRIDEMIESITSTFEQWKHLERKDFALKFGRTGENHAHFGLMMHLYSEKEPDYKNYFEKNYLKEIYSLRQLNILQSVAEIEQ
jgi:RNA ligase